MNEEIKSCPHCGAQLPAGASFCPHCAQTISERNEITPPRHVTRRALYSALMVLLILAVALAAWTYTRPKVYDNGTAEVIYTDDDGSYQLLAGFGSDRFRPAHEMTETVEEGMDYRMPSRLYVNHADAGENAKEAFFQKVEGVAVELLRGGEGASPWRCEPPVEMDFDPEAARISLLTYAAESGPMELRWTLTMKNGDTIRLYQRVDLDVIPTLHYTPENCAMNTAGELQALVDEINKTADPEAIVYLHLPAVTYQGGLVMGGRPINLLGSEGENGARTTFTGPVRATMAGHIYGFENIDFTGPGDGVGVSVSARLHLTGCRLSGWRTGLLCYGNSWVNFQDCVFEDNTVGFHFNASNATPTTYHYSGNLFQNNGTAVLLESVPSDQALYFDGTRFSRNGTDIDNRCGHEVSIAAAIFE